MTQLDPQPGPAAGPEPTAATVVPPSTETTALVPPAVEATETVPLPLSGSAPYPPGPYPPPQASLPYRYPYPYPVPPAPPARNGFGLLVGVIVGVVALMLLGGVATVVLVSRTHSNPLAARGPNRLSATPAPTPSRTPTPFSADLRTVLLAVPAGATKLSNTSIGNADGTVSLEQAAKTYAGDNTVVDYLTSMGYAQGATVGWKTASTNTSVHVLLFQFYQDLGDRWLRGVVKGFDGSDRVDGRGDLSGVPGGRYYIFTHSSNDSAYSIECYFLKYDIAVDIWMFTPNKPDPADVTALAQQQYAQLP